MCLCFALSTKLIVFSSAFKNSYFIIIYVYVYICHMYASAPRAQKRSWGYSWLWVPWCGFQDLNLGLVEERELNCPSFLLLIPVYYASFNPIWIPKFFSSLFGHGALKWFTNAHAHLTKVVKSPVGTQRPVESLALLPNSSMLFLVNFMGPWFFSSDKDRLIVRS